MILGGEYVRREKRIKERRENRTKRKGKDSRSDDRTGEESREK